MKRHTNKDKAAKHEAKGDELLKKGKHKKALSEYRKAFEKDPERAGIFDKLMETKDQIKDEWDLKDFAESVSWAMGKQEQDHPPIKQVHAMLSPEWKVATEMAFKIVMAEKEQDVGKDIEKLVSMGEIATRALIGILLSLKHGQEDKITEKEI